MSWPRLSFKMGNGGGRTCFRIKSWDGQEARVSLHEWRDPPPADCPDNVSGGHYCDFLITVKREDILWVNTEAAQNFDFSGIKVIGIGYGADQKLEAHLASKPK